MVSLVKSAMDYCNYRIEQMRAEKSSWTLQEKQLVDNFMPRRGKFHASDRNKGGKKKQLPNNRGILAKRILRSGMMTGITSPARPWFKLAPPDPEMAKFGPVRAWVDNPHFQEFLFKVGQTVSEDTLPPRGSGAPESIESRWYAKAGGKK